MPRAPRAALVVLLAASALAGSSCRDRSGRSEVVLYCSVDQEVAEPIVAEFERQSGIKVLARYDTEASKTVGLVQRIRAEAGNPAADAFWSGEVFHTVRLAREGLLTPYCLAGGELGVPDTRMRDAPADCGPECSTAPQSSGPGAALTAEIALGPPAERGQDARDTGCAAFADPNGRWYGFALRARVIGYNTNKVSAQEAPKSLEDALGAKWKGRLVMASPASGTTGGDVASWFAHYGPDRARDILRRLKENHVWVVSGNSTAVRKVANGEADICFTDTDDIYAGQRNGWPVAMNYLDQGGDGVLVIPNTAALLRGGPHPEAARKLMAFLLSEDLERLLARSDSHNSPVHPAAAREYRQYAIPKPLAVDYERVADFLPMAIETAREILE
jgi:iron(III) transport system substrate-binding protein